MRATVHATVGARIRSTRERQGLSQTALAEGLTVSSSYISLIEADKRTPSRQILALLAEKLGCSVNYLLTGRGGTDVEELETELRFAELALRNGDAAAAGERFAKVLATAERGGYEDVADDALWGLSRAQEGLGQLETAIQGFETLIRQPRLATTVSRTLVTIALCRSYAQCGDVSRAIDLGESALHILDAGQISSPDCDEAVELACTLVGCYYERGDLMRAHLLARRAVVVAERSGSWRARAAAYWEAGLVADARGDLRAARTYTDRALALYSEGDNARAAALLRIVSGALLLHMPEPDVAEAERFLRRALRELPDVGSPLDIAMAETELARCQLLMGRPDLAVGTATAALERLLPGPRLETARARAVLGDAELAQGDMRAAVGSYTQAAQELQRLGASRQAAEVWCHLGEAFSEMGLVTEANAAYRQAVQAVGIAGLPRPTRHPVSAATDAKQR